MDADGALVEFGKVDDFVDWFGGIDVGGMGGIDLKRVSGNEMTLAVSGIAVVDAIVLNTEAADGGGHPTILVAMIVDAAALSDFPTDGHAFEEIVFENEIASVVTFGEVAKFF